MNPADLYLGEAFKLIAAEVKSVQLVEEGERREGVDLVGVQDEALQSGTAQDGGQGREVVAGKVQVLQTFQAGEEAGKKLLWVE